MSPETLRAVMPWASEANAERFAGPLSAAMQEFEINTTGRQAAFLAQIAHESGSLRWTLELASGRAYEGRADLGNTKPGDGVRYKGRGLIQITGKNNYAECGAAFSLPLLDHPELLEQPEWATRSAAWWWKEHGCNEIADSGDFAALTRRINGALTGYSERLAAWDRAKAALA